MTLCLHYPGKIPQLRVRLECYNYKQSFPSKVEDVKPHLLLVKQVDPIPISPAVLFILTQRPLRA